MIVLQLLLLAILLPTLCLGPGYFFVRRLPWRTREIIASAIGLSVLLDYLAATVIYLWNLDWRWCWLSTAGGLLLTIFAGRDLVRLVQKPNVRKLLVSFGFLLLTALLMLSLIQHYSGASWAGDWLEHYQRTRYFLLREPPSAPNRLFLGQYHLTARPPMMNLVASYFLAHVGSGFDCFQVVFQFLNLLAYFPMVLLAGMLARYGGRRVWQIGAVLALSPTFMENATWPWTKLLSAFFVLLSVALYLRGWRKNDMSRMIGSAMSMAAALLVHYSAGPYAIAIFIHYLIIFKSRRHKFTEPALCAGVGILLLATWFTWAIATYGTRTTLKSNTTAVETEKLTLAENIEKIGTNMLATFVPHPFTRAYHLSVLQFDQPNPFGFVRDYFFVIYQTNLTLALGSIGWIAVCWLMCRQLSCAAASIRLFWILFIAISIVGGIAVHGPVEFYGVVHVCLQPIILVSLALLASGLRLLPRWVRNVLVFGMAVDAVLGIVLNTRAQMHLFTLLRGAGAEIIPIDLSWLSMQAVQNSALRQQLRTVYFSDHAWLIHDVFFIAIIAAIGIALLIVAATTRDGSTQRRRPGALGIAALELFIVGVIVCRLDSYFGYGLTYPQRPQPQASLEREDRAIAASPDSPEVYYQCAVARYNQGELEPAAYDLFDAFLLDPFDLRPRRLLFVLFVTHGFAPVKTNAWIAQMFNENPHDVDSQMDLVQILADRGHELPALRRLRDAVFEHPNAPRVKAALAKLNGNLADIERTIQIRERELNR